ncbi:AAA family ATPase [Nocardia sp. BMG51109]|uniref:ATP-binding protein n=1 Tax=Nocardia sp. BMG51109 TaxID=1056816 RepID=UPI0012EC9147|nr:AAA family ATPase [Nocardia sp. BMG51109]
MTVRHQDSPSDLPIATEGFVGRDAELAELTTLLLGPQRLITLIGSGGIGKTRLAAEAVRRLRTATRIPVHYLRLARLAPDSDPAAVAEAIAATVLPGFAGSSTWQTLVDTLSRTDATGRSLPTVLVLDNCEHVLDAVGPVIAELLAAVDGATILATSREPVGWVDERLLQVPPLTRPQALDLFRQRAELTGHPVTGADQIEVAERICHRMHGHPLFIRLAAARAFYEPLPMILRQLSGDEDDGRMQWRHGPRVGTDNRHRTIGDVIAWSYELCDDKERLLFERMSVFAPGNHGDTGLGDTGAEPEAIEAVCADDPPVGQAAGPYLAPSEIRDVLHRLTDRSLVSAHITPTAVRYSLVESLRLFARQRLRERSGGAADEPRRLAERHLRYHRDKVVHAQAHWCSPAEHDLMEWVRHAWEDIRLAIERSTTIAGAGGLGLETATALIALRAPFFNDLLHTTRRWTERALESTRDVPEAGGELRITAMASIAWISLWEGRDDRAAELLDRCAGACVSAPEVRNGWRDRPETDIELPAAVEFAWGAFLLLRRCDAGSAVVLARARDKYAAQGDRGGESLSSLFASVATAFFGTARHALDATRNHLERTTNSGARWAKSWAELARAIALTKHGAPAEALTALRSALAYQLPRRDLWGVLWAVNIRMWSLTEIIADAATGDFRRSALATEIACLAGASATLGTRLGTVEVAPFAGESTRALEVACGVLGRPALDTARIRGSRLSLESAEMRRLALGATDDTPQESVPARTVADTWHTLTGAEQDVAILAAAGWPNSAIGARRGTSIKTVNTQVTSILQKLTITSREDIIGFVPHDRRDWVSREHSRRPRRGGARSRRVDAPG